MKINISNVLCIVLMCIGFQSTAQLYKLKGKVTNSKMEPLSFVTVQVKEEQIGTRTDEQGNYEFKLEAGEYELLFSLLGYEKQQIKLIHQNNSTQQNIILKESTNDLGEIKIVNFKKDRAEEIIKNVIRQKETISSAAKTYTANVYIKALQENATQGKKKQTLNISDSAKQAQYKQELAQMSMSEISLQLDVALPNKKKETRLGVKKRGNSESLFFLTTTDGDFNLYDNLIQIPALSEVPMLSPISYSGLVAYKYKTTQIKKFDRYTLYNIHFTPTKMGNALIEGDVQIVDTSWAIVQTNFTFPKFHMPEYDYFEARIEYDFIAEKAWLPKRQEFIYSSKSGNSKSSGKTVAIYDEYVIDTTFSKRYFRDEIGSTSLAAYKQDSNFWNTVRKEPLTDKEVSFIAFKDSVYRATHSKAYLDSIDRIENKITWKKVLLFGYENYNRSKERTINFAPVISIFRPFFPGGTRYGLSLYYRKQFENKKSVSIAVDASYGPRNNNIIGDVRLYRLYNPFSRGYFAINGGRKFDLIFFGDAYINLLRRSNFYKKDHIELEHGLEIFNGFVLRNSLEIANRQSLADLKLNTQADSLFKDSYFFNQPVDFKPYNALFASITLEYTPFQKYLREPLQKVILGSKFPMIYAKWRKGVHGVLNSEIDFDYVEVGLKQRLHLGLAGISEYHIYSGEFISQKDLRYVDYKFISRGNPGLFNNPMTSFQALDSTFPVFKRFYEAHYLHQFNGSLINKIPVVKKLNLLEVAGTSMLYLPERNLKYFEAFVGLEKIIRIWNERFKIGYYVVVSAANKNNNPFQFKVGFDQYNKRKNSWN